MEASSTLFSTKIHILWCTCTIFLKKINFGRTSKFENITFEHYASLINFQKAENIPNICLLEISLSEIFFIRKFHKIRYALTDRCLKNCNFLVFFFLGIVVVFVHVCMLVVCLLLCWLLLLLPYSPWRFHTFALGPDICSELMAELAAMTGGHCLVIEEEDRLQSKVTNNDGCEECLFMFVTVCVLAEWSIIVTL